MICILGKQLCTIIDQIGQIWTVCSVTNNHQYIIFNKSNSTGPVLNNPYLTLLSWLPKAQGSGISRSMGLLRLLFSTASRFLSEFFWHLCEAISSFLLLLLLMSLSFLLFPHMEAILIFPVLHPLFFPSSTIIF